MNEEFNALMKGENWQSHMFKLRSEAANYWWTKGNTIYYPDGRIMNANDYGETRTSTPWQQCLNENRGPIAFW